MTTGAFPRPWRIIEHAESRRRRAAQGRSPADGREFRHATGSECWSAPWGVASALVSLHLVIGIALSGTVSVTVGST
jgi:hypothetical protein